MPRRILAAFTRERMTMTSDDLEELRVEYEIGKNAFARARAELTNLGWIRMEHGCDDEGDPRRWGAWGSTASKDVAPRTCADTTDRRTPRRSSSATRCSGIAKASWTKG